MTDDRGFAVMLPMIMLSMVLPLVLPLVSPMVFSMVLVVSLVFVTCELLRLFATRAVVKLLAERDDE